MLEHRASGDYRHHDKMTRQNLIARLKSNVTQLWNDHTLLKLPGITQYSIVLFSTDDKHAMGNATSHDSHTIPSKYRNLHLNETSALTYRMF